MTAIRPTARASTAVAVLIMLAACDHAQWVETPSPWALQRVDGRELRLLVSMGGDEGCERFDRVDVDEDGPIVELTAVVDVRHGAGSCADSGKLERVRVTLARPLGDRTLTGCRVEGRPDFSVRATCDEIADEGV